MAFHLLGQIRYRLHAKSKWGKWHYYYTDEETTLCGWHISTPTHTREVMPASFDYSDMRCAKCQKKRAMGK